jgi:hypothetical protein
MNSRHGRLLFVAVVFLTALAAAGSGMAYGQTATEPCGLLTQDQVQAALGVAVGPGQSITPTSCQWSADPPGSSAARVTVELLGAQTFAGIKMPLRGITKTRLSEVGDDAVYATVASLTTLSVKKGNVVFIVRVYGIPGQDKQMAIEKALALDILAKL